MSEVEGMTAKQKLVYYQDKMYKDALEGKAKGELVCCPPPSPPVNFARRWVST